MRNISHKEQEIPLMQILTPLREQFFQEHPVPEHPAKGTADKECVSGQELTHFERLIMERLSEGKTSDTDKNVFDLMQYFKGAKGIQEKVESAIVSIKNIDGILYGCTTLTLNEFPEGAELTELCSYITGPSRDDREEGVKQPEKGNQQGHYAYFVERDVLKVPQKIDISEELNQRACAPQPKLKLLGHDGNIFSILADAKRLLMKNGQREEADEMIKRVETSGDYYKALGVISEYVETELSAPKERIDKKK